MKAKAINLISSSVSKLPIKPYDVRDARLRGFTSGYTPQAPKPTEWNANTANQ